MPVGHSADRHSSCPPPRPRILIVEDEAIIALDLEVTLSSMGFDVVGKIETSENLLRIVSDTAPDVIILDIKLHGEIDGITAARHLKGLTKAQIVILTAHKSLRGRVAEELGADVPFIVKPHSWPHLETTLKRMVGEVRWP